MKVAEMISSLCTILCSIILLTAALFPIGIHGDQPHFVYNDCLSEPSGNFTQNSFYQKNLNSLLTDLTSQSASLSFYNSTAGTAPDNVYGLFICRYDLPSEDCRACVEAAVQKLSSNCTREREAIGWYEECTLRYANRNIFSLKEENTGYTSYSKNNVSMDVDQFYDNFYVALDGLIKQAAYNTTSPTKYFKTQVTRISATDTLYLLVLCTPDIDSASCDRCLRATVPYLPWRGMIWAMVFWPSCQMRYDLAAFFTVDSAPATPPLSSPPSSSKGVMFYILRAAIPAAVGLLLLIGIFICFIKRRGRKPTALPRSQPAVVLEQGVSGGGGGGGMQTTDQCVQLEFKTLEAATSRFSQANKLGQGGFGIVYRGVLANGQQVAVKRLSTISGQGTKEFKTEVEVVAQLQHRNLVRLVGYSLEGEERLLVYEFLPNLSLDNFLFGSVKAASLTWAIRYKIIVGIARGLHYLHEDSRIKIVHRDLKSSNILLDDNLDPKIADFGMARLMLVNQTQANTTKVVGTFGYIAPEYALAGRCTPKSDIYSFGVIILEILSGKSCNKFYQTSHGEGLLRYAWRVWSEEAFENLVDPVLQNNYPRSEVERCIRIGLLCVQDDEANRPTTQALLIMLSSNSVELPSPFPPSLFSNSISMPSTTEGHESQGGRSSYEETKSANTGDGWFLDKDLYAR